MVLTMIIVVAILASSCSVPAGGGSGGSDCEWEQKRSRSRSHSLTIVDLTRSYAVGYATVSRPGPRPGGASRPKISIVKPTGRKPVRMPVVKPHKPAYAPKPGYRWVLDCD